MGFLKGVTDAINSKIKQVGGGSGTRKKGGGTASGGKGMSQLRQDLNGGLSTIRQDDSQSGANRLRRDLGIGQISPSPTRVEPKQSEIVRPTYGSSTTVPTRSALGSTAPPEGTASYTGSTGTVPTRSALGIPINNSMQRDDTTNQTYMDYFRQAGLDDKSEQEIEDRSDKSWIDILMGNPATKAITDGIEYPEVGGMQTQIPVWHNPFLDISVDDVDNDFENDLTEQVEDEVNSLRETGNFTRREIPSEYQADNSTSIGDIHAIDDGTMDYDHLTADLVRGDIMQNYVNLGMGGRDWWLYDPLRIYRKSDEAQEYGFRPYQPDQTSSANLRMSNALDTVTDATGFIGDMREKWLPYALQDIGIGDGGYKIKYDVDGNPETTDDVITLDGRDFDYRSDAYRHNMDRLMATHPEYFMSMPEGGALYGAPVTESILETRFKGPDGKTNYVYENIGDIYDATKDYVGYTLHVPYKDGTSIDIEQEDYEKWLDENGQLQGLPQWVYDAGEIDFDGLRFNDDPKSVRFTMPDGQVAYMDVSAFDDWLNGVEGSKLVSEYVPIDQIGGTLPDDYESLNQKALEGGNIEDAVIRYMPDLVMDDGTRLTFDQFDRIYTDRDIEDNPDNPNDDGISYDYTWLNKPKRLLKNDGQIFNSDMTINPENIVTSAIDSTLGSLPIMFDKFAWPISVADMLSTSLSGLNSNGHDALTDSDKYIAAEYDEDHNLVPTYNDLQMISNVAGTALIPATEQIAGPISGHSLIEGLSGELPINPTLAQVLKAYLIGAIGEGIEEIPGNVFDELFSQADAAYGDVITRNGERLLQDKDPMSILMPADPVVNEDGSYMFVGKDGEPMEYSSDEVGHVYKDRNTPLGHRIANFLDGSDILNALLGGALVDTMMTAPGMVTHDIPVAISNDAYRRNMGLRQYVEPEMRKPENRYTVDPDLIRGFSDEPYVESE